MDTIMSGILLLTVGILGIIFIELLRKYIVEPLYKVYLFFKGR